MIKKIKNSQLSLFEDVLGDNNNSAIKQSNYKGRKTDKTLLFMTSEVTMTENYQMPIVAPYKGVLPENIMGINRAKYFSDPMISPHFFLEDNLINQYYYNPYRTEKILYNFHTSIATDFSMTNEMAFPQKIFSSFLNKLWAAWLQSRGHNVIANVSFPDEYWEDYWIEGWPKDSIIAVSSNGVIRHGNPCGWLKGFERIVTELEPIQILRYGPYIKGEPRERCIYFNNDTNRSVNGW